MNYASLKLFDTQNGPGVRVSLFVSGCTLNCPGCFNREAQNFKFGHEFSETVQQKIIDALKDPDVDGISILGGDPCEPKNVAAVLELCRAIREQCPNKTIWLWTGRKLEELRKEPVTAALMLLCNVIVDGPFIQELADERLLYRGSFNQHVIDLGRVFGGEELPLVA